MKEAAGNAKVFSVDLKCGDVEQHDFGKFTLTIACDITLQDGKTITVTNKTDIDRSMETVEVSLDRLGDMPKAEFVV